MTRRRWIQKKGGGLVEVPVDQAPAPRVAPIIMGDTPGYQSPVTGLWVEGRKQRREDLKRSGCRPWEGKDQEVKEADRQKAYREERADQKLEEAVRRSYHQLDPEQRRVFD